jgi:hypothetical protein
LLMSYMHRSPAAAAAQTSSASNCKLIIYTFSTAEYILYCRMIFHLGAAGDKEGLCSGQHHGRRRELRGSAQELMTSAVSAPCDSPLLAHILVGRSTSHHVTPRQQPLLHQSDLHCAHETCQSWRPHLTGL